MTPRRKFRCRACLPSLGELKRHGYCSFEVGPSFDWVKIAQIPCLVSSEAENNIAIPEWQEVNPKTNRLLRKK